MNKKYSKETSKVLNKIYEFQKREKTIYNELFLPALKLEELGLKDTIVFFGSSMIINTDVLTCALLKPQSERTEKEQNLIKLNQYYIDAEILAEKLTNWLLEKFNGNNHCVICSGGGPGLMEAANKGAKKAGGKSIGFNIKIPFEQTSNIYQSEEMKFMFHYFFMRKYWFSYLARAVVVFPGGFGTLDELFEFYTLMVTKKAKRKIPIILFGKEFWNSVINFETLLKWGTIPERFRKIINIQDDVDEVFEFLKENTVFSEE